MSNRQQYEDKVKAEFAALEAEVDRLKKHIHEAKSELLPKHHHKLEEIRELTARAREKLDELAEASEDSWEHLKDGIDHYWDALGKEVKSFEEM